MDLSLKEKIKEIIVPPRNIGVYRLTVIIVSSIISISVLGYQTLEYINNSCGCGENIPELTEIFREYGQVVGVPIALIGLGGVGFILIQTVLLGYSSNNYEIKLLEKKIFSSSSKLLRTWYIFLLIQLLGCTRLSGRARNDLFSIKGCYVDLPTKNSVAIVEVIEMNHEQYKSNKQRTRIYL